MLLQLAILYCVFLPLQGQPGYLQFLHGIVTDVYLDHYKFKGQNVAGNVPKLQRILEKDYSLERLLKFFSR